MYPRNAPNPLSEEMILNGKLEPTNEGYALAKIVTARLCEYIHRENSNFQYFEFSNIHFRCFESCCQQRKETIKERASK